MRLSAFSPFGPIFGKELRVTARRKRGYLLRVIYLAGLMLFLLLAYTSTSAMHGNNASAVAQAQQQQELGPIFFAFFSMFCVSAMALIGPVLTSTAISSEKLHKTLAVLLMTPINAWQIIAGKLFSRLLTALMLIGLSLPVLALVRLLGGVELNQMFGVIVMCSVTALFGAAVGLFFSTFMNRAYAVILLSYATSMFLHLFVPFVMALLIAQSSTPRSQMRWFYVFSAINPFVSTMFLAMPEARMTGTAGWQVCAILHTALAAILVACSALIVRRIARGGGEGSSRGAAAQPAVPMPMGIPLAITDSGAPVLDATPVAAPLPAPPPRKERRAANVWDNPVLWREYRRPLMAKRWQRIVGSLLCVGLLLVVYVSLDRNDRGQAETQIGFAFVFQALMMLLVCVLSATAIAQEKEGDTWTLLLVTPLSANSVVLGKVLGLLRRLVAPMILIAGHFLIFTLTGVIDVESFFLILWVILTFNAVWAATGIYLSLRCRKVTFAVILNLLLPIFAYAAVPILLLLIGEFFVTRNGGDDLAESMLIYLPYYYLAEGIQWLNGNNYNYPQNTIHIDWLDDQVTRSGFLWITFVAGCAQLVIAALILWRAARDFNRVVGRAAQRGKLLPAEMRSDQRPGPV